MTQDTSSIVFDRRAGQVTRAVLLRGNEHQVTDEVLQELEMLPYRTSDLLMRHDAICFSIYGENLTIPVFLKAFGVSGLMKLLAQGAIKYHLQSSIITHSVTDAKGLHPLQSGCVTTSIHKDPSASVEVALRGLVHPPDPASLRALSKSLADAYISPSSDYAPAIVQQSHDAYIRGRFSQLDLPADEEIGQMSLANRGKLAKLAQELFDLAIIADLKLESLDEFAIEQLCDSSLQTLANTHNLADAAVTIFKIENVPQLSHLFASGVLDTRNLSKLRRNPHVIRFRKWLRSTVANVDAAEIGRAYIDAVSRKGSFFESGKGKLLKSLSVSGLTALSGAAIAGPAGVIAGATVGPIVEKAFDASLSLLDQFVLDGVLKGWQPRHYFDKVIIPALRERQQ